MKAPLRICAIVWLGSLCLAQKQHVRYSDSTPEFRRLEAAFHTEKEGWVCLYNGKDLSRFRPLRKPNEATIRANDWETPRVISLDRQDPEKLARASLPAKLASSSEPLSTPAFVNNRQGKSPSLVTVDNHRDVEIYIEFAVPQHSNSGVCLMGLYEIQIYDSFGKQELNYRDNGGIYAPVVGDGRAGGRPPSVNVSRAPGEWQSFHIWFRAPRFDRDGKKTEDASFLRVEHNGTLIHENFELPSPTRAQPPWAEQPSAPLLLQGDHGPVAFRNIYIRPLRGAGT